MRGFWEIKVFGWNFVFDFREFWYFVQVISHALVQISRIKKTQIINGWNENGNVWEGEKVFCHTTCWAHVGKSLISWNDHFVVFVCVYLSLFSFCCANKWINKDENYDFYVLIWEREREGYEQCVQMEYLHEDESYFDELRLTRPQTGGLRADSTKTNRKI